ncbi:Primosomal protein N' [Bacillus thuringiensis serovar israelensis ATCC 35646]|nr:Primosomal protein N' [Bacillus thuringiensis serovar israelensis ATCC 35646]
MKRTKTIIPPIINFGWYSVNPIPFLNYLKAVTGKGKNWPSFLTNALARSKQWLVGPGGFSIPRIKDKYRYQCLINYKREPNLKTCSNGK